MDDDSGWDAILIAGWGPLVRAAVIDRVERETVGRHGFLVRALQDSARYALAEQLHQIVLAAIRVETGADLDQLGSQAAWACYEEVWEGLAARWRDGSRLAPVRQGHEEEVAAVLAQLPAPLAEAAGADVGTIPCTPMTIAGRMRLDVEGLWSAQAAGGRPFTAEEQAQITKIVALTD